MDYKVFYRKYRPSSFDELIGQDNIKEILVNSIKTNRIAHAYIFTGPRGTGKTSTAKIFAKTLNCKDNVNGVSCNKCDACLSYVESPDIIEIDAASNNGVEEIRTLRDSVKIAPYNSKFKVYIIDEVHMLSNSAWNAFLKTLEEPPGHVIFILATTEINKIPETVMSRCQRFDFGKIPSNQMKNHLLSICCKENVNIKDEALDELIKLSNGCLRDALSYLDKVSKFGTEITEDIIQSNFGTLSNNYLESLYKDIINGEKSNINLKIDEISNMGLTPLNFINEFVEYLLNKLLERNTNNYNEINTIKDLIFKLNKITLNFNAIVNPFTLIKVELITLNYFPGNNNVNISQEMNENSKEIVNKFEKIEKNVDKCQVVNVAENNDVEVDVKSKCVNLYKFDVNKLRDIRINNSYVNVSKEIKKEFVECWNKFLDELNLTANYNLLGYLENINIEVVSLTNVLFSFNTLTESMLFNENIKEIENEFNQFNGSDYAFYALSKDDWLIEKQKFIKNKNYKYEYIKEEIEENKSADVKTFDIANDIFGDELIEIR